MFLLREKLLQREILVPQMVVLNCVASERGFWTLGTFYIARSESYSKSLHEYLCIFLKIYFVSNRNNGPGAVQLNCVGCVHIRGISQYLWVSKLPVNEILQRDGMHWMKQARHISKNSINIDGFAFLGLPESKDVYLASVLTWHHLILDNFCAKQPK